MAVERHTQAEIDMIHGLLSKLGIKKGWLVDVGANDGIFQSNTLELTQAGWDSVLIEADPEKFAQLKKNMARFARVRLVNEKIIINLDEVLRQQAVPLEFDLLQIDIDGLEYWVWLTSAEFKPKIVSVEYNSNFEPWEFKTIYYEPEFKWSGDSYYGASAAALAHLGKTKGYTLVGYTSWSNLYFVRSDLLGDIQPLDIMDVPKEPIHPPTTYEFLELKRPS